MNSLEAILQQEKTHIKKVTKKAKRAIMVSMLACSLMLLLQLFLPAFIPVSDSLIISKLLDITVYLLYLVIPFGFAQIIYKKVFNEKDHCVKRIVPKKPLLFISGVLGAGYLVNLTVNLLLGWFLKDFTVDTIGEISHSPIDIILNYILMALCPAIVEEWAFRGVIFKNLRPYGRFGALVISSLLFGLMHIDLPRIIFASCFGFLLGVCCDYTGSIKIPILIHFINNALSVTITVVGDDFTTTAICSLVIFALMGCGIFALVYYIRNGIAEKQITLNKPAVYGYKLTVPKFLKQSFLNIGFVIMFIIFGVFFYFLYFYV